MELTDLPRDPLTEIGLRASPRDLINYCLTNRTLLPICQDPGFQTAYLSQYGLSGTSISGGNFFDLLEWMGGFDWNLVPGQTLAEKGQYIVQTIQMASQFDPMSSIRRRYRPRPGVHSIVYYVYPGVSEVVGRAARTRNPIFLQQILNGYIPLVRGEPAFQNSLRGPFLGAIRAGGPWLGVVNTLLQYYDARNDPILRSGSYADAIRTGDLAFVQALANIFPPDEEGFWMALQHNQPQMATWIRNQLLAQGVDPIRPEALHGEYLEAISEGDLAYIRRLTQYGLPTRDHLDWAIDQNQPQIAAFLQNHLQ